MKSPYVNAVAACVYIVSIALFLQTVPPLLDTVTVPPFLAISVMLSLLTLSVALMGFLFFFQPLVLIVEKQYKESAVFFIKTSGAFAVCFILLIATLAIFF